MATKIETTGYTSSDENDLRQRFIQMVRDCPIPDAELLANLPLFI
jgi:hypothetical protein